MATQSTQGLLDELGLGPVNEMAAQQKGMPPMMQASGNVGAFMQLGQKLGRQVGGGIAGLVNTVTDRKDGEGFFANFKEGSQNVKDAAIAKGLGLNSIDELHKQRKVRKAVGRISTPSTGDPIADQQAMLDQIIKIGNANNDTALVAKAMAKKQQLKKDAQDFKKSEQGIDIKQSEFERDVTTGVDIVPEGADSTGKDFQPSSAVYVEEGGEDKTGAWLVTHPNGEQEWQDQINPYDSEDDSTSKAGTRVSENLQSVSIQQAGGGKSYNAKRESVIALADNSDITSEVTDLFLSFNDPSAITAWFGKGSSIADKGVRFLESTTTAFTGGNIGDGTYTDNFSGRKIKDDQYVYNGKVVSSEKQKELFIEGATDFEIPIPEHLRAQLAEVANGAAQYRALIMEMAYMDARLQEPSNRGLSDNDIKNALDRVGADTANPVSFLDRQISRTRRGLNKLDQMGGELSPYITGEGVQLWSTQDIKENIYAPELMAKTRTRMISALDKMVDARTRIVSAQIDGQRSGEEVSAEENDDDFLTRMGGT